MKILVCGGRGFCDYVLLNTVLDSLRKQDCYHAPVIIQGGARGADALAKRYAMDYGLKCEEYPADWDKHKKAAGPIRNQQMLDVGKPDVVVAFAGGSGTADMVKRAKKAGIKVMEIL